jgi:cysteinyl-tRNA synthetase
MDRHTTRFWEILPEFLFDLRSGFRYIACIPKKCGRSFLILQGFCEEFCMTRIRLILTATLIFAGCDKDQVKNPEPGNVDYRQEMREFVQAISQYAKARDADFIVIPQNGQELIARNGELDGPLAEAYLSAIDGTGREDLFYGYEEDNEPTPEEDKEYMIGFCDRCEQNSVEVLVIDYCSAHDRMDDSYAQNQAKGYISFAAPERNLNIIPDYPQQPFNKNAMDISALSEARNFLYLINGENYETKESFIQAVSATSYDLIVMDCFFNDQIFSSAEIGRLKTKPNGGARLVISYMSIGEAEDYRFYWNAGWENNPPDWLDAENPDWPGNYKVRYWEEEWQAVIFGAEEAYLDQILSAGFDGVYLDIIDAFEYFEAQN